jgi:hypothetical protein
MSSADRLKFIAELQGVREVSLAGSADFVYWRKVLEPEGLVPVDSGGHAQLMVVSADAKFRGVRFQELSFSVLAVRTDGRGEPGAFLVQAFNSRRLFAFCERWLFKTPYTLGQVSLNCGLPGRIRLELSGSAAFLAQMRQTPIDDGTFQEAAGMEGPIYLPSKGRRRRVFFACIRGDTLKVPFREGSDSLSIASSGSVPILQQLVDSAFAPIEWQLRHNAYHAKSKTYAEDRR